MTKFHHVLAASALTFATHSAIAAPITVYNTTVQAWNVGSGQSNGQFAVTTDSAVVPGFDIELGLRGQTRFVGNIMPDGGNTNSYTVPAGVSTGSTFALWNIDYSATARAQAGTTSLPATTASSLTLTLMDDDGSMNVVNLLNPLNLALRPAGSLEVTGTYAQLANSWNPNFGFMLGGLWDNIGDQWLYASLRGVYGPNNTSVTTDACFHVSGADASCGGKLSAVPLPGSLALLLVGGVAFFCRKAK